MFDVLLASAHAEKSHPLAPAFAASAHAALIVGAIIATRTIAIPRRSPPAVAAPYVIAVPDRDRNASPPTAAVNDVARAQALPSVPPIAVPLSVPIGIATVTLRDPSGDIAARIAASDASLIAGRENVGTITAGAALDAATVDDPVEPLQLDAPAYPPAMRAAGISATVTLHYIVDTLGKVEPASIVAVDTTYPAFVAAARGALLRGRFRAARVRGHVVRQLVQQRFRFAVVSP